MHKNTLKRLVIVTDVKFWRKGAGHRSRIRELVNYIKKIVNLKVLFVGEESANVKEQLIENICDYTIIFFDGVESIEKCRNFIISDQPDLCIVEYLHLTSVISDLPASITTYLDTHDLVSRRELSFKKQGYDHSGLSQDEEIKILSKFDYIILISQEELNIVSQHISLTRLILCQHPAVFTKQKRLGKVSTVGFVGSEYLPNIDAMQWFLSHVWPCFHTAPIILKIYGNVCNHLEVNSSTQNVKLKGYVSDINKMYSEIDIVINPVRMGSGLKIKNIEALSSGLPLITTSHGAASLRYFSEKAFLIADDKDQFIQAILQLKSDDKLRGALSNSAYLYSRKFHSPETCFRPLVKSFFDN